MRSATLVGHNSGGMAVGGENRQVIQMARENSYISAAGLCAGV